MMELKKLNVGSGKNLFPGWINVDCHALPGVDIVCRVGTEKLPLDDNSIDIIFCSHTLEHVENSLAFMEELHRVAKPGCEATFMVPYGSNDIADEDPTHVKRYFLNSFQYFAQLVYHKADYGYRGDWDTEMITLDIPGKNYEGKSTEDVMLDIKQKRNIVEQMTAKLIAVKPIREPNPAPTQLKLMLNFI